MLQGASGFGVRHCGTVAELYFKRGRFGKCPLTSIDFRREMGKKRQQVRQVKKTMRQVRPKGAAAAAAGPQQKRQRERYVEAGGFLQGYSPESVIRLGYFGAAAIDALVAVGPETAPLAAAARAAGVAVTEVPDAATALDAARGFVAPGDAVLVKGSRAVGLELVATALRGSPPEGATGP